MRNTHIKYFTATPIIYCSENKSLPKGENCMEDSYQIDLVDIGRMLWRNWLKIVIAGLIGAIVAAIVTVAAITPMYQSTAKMVILNKQQINITYSDIQTSTQLTNDCVQVLKSADLMDKVIDALNLDMTAGQLLSKIAVTAPEDTRVLQVTVTDSDPERARQLAYEIYTQASEVFVNTLDIDAVNLFEEPKTPSSPSSPNKSKNIMMGGIAGAFLVVAFLLVQKLTNNKIYTVEDVENNLSLTLLAAIPDSSDDSALKRKKRRRFRRLMRFGRPSKSNKSSRGNA